MENKRFTYGIDLDYEFYTHQFVGHSLETEEKTGMRYLQMKNHQHLKCSTYSEWKKHVLEVLPDDKNYLDDMKHYLKKGKRYAELLRDGATGILVPICIVLCTFLHGHGYGGVVFGITFIVIVLIGSTLVWSSYGHKVSFYDDFIEIIEDEQRNKA